MSAKDPEAIAEALWQQGWSVVPGYLDPQATRALAAECREGWRDGAFRQAGVGIGSTLRVDDEVRRDHVQWLDEAESPAQQAYLRRLEELRLAINRQLMLGLFEFEGHLTVYPPGAFYRTHLDQFRGTAHRLVSCILYLNDDWRFADGGQLRIYLDPCGEAGEVIDVNPLGGTLVTFLSERFYHEVLPARRERMSLTGWFKRRN